MATSEQSAVDLPLSRLLNPSSIAVVGATDRLGAFTGDTIHNLLRYGFRGSIFPVNPRRSDVLGLRCYPSLLDLPDPVDCVMLAVSADRVLPVLEDCVAVGADSAIVAASGFGEGGAGAAGMERRRRLDEFLDRHPMALLGPSTTGLINLFDSFVPRAATNMLPVEAVRPGPVAVISQSGACNNIIFNRAQEHGCGIGLAVATGLQAALSIWDIAAHALGDERITVLSVLVEELGPATVWRPVLETARRRGVSIVVCKLGQSERGGQAVATHSGSIAGSWRAQEHALRDAGALIAADLDQLWEVAALCAAWGPPTGPVRLGAVAMSGGEGALITDLADVAGVAMPDVTPRFDEVVAEHLTLTRGANPFDPTGEVLGRPQVLDPVLDAFIGQPAFDRVLVAWHVLDDNVLVGVWPQLRELFVKHRSRLAVSGWPLSDLPHWRDLCDATWPPFIPGSHRAVHAIASYSRGVTEPATASYMDSASVRALPAELGSSYSAAREVLAGLGVPFGRQVVVATEEQAVAAAGELGWPLVLKADVASIVHKSAAGLVEVGLRHPEQVREAWGRLVIASHGCSRTILAEEHLVGEVQLFVGMRVDPEVGPMLLFGSGGVTVEILGDIAIAPAHMAAVERLVRRSAVGGFLLTRAPQAVERVREICAALIALSHDARIDAAELNPVIVDLRTQSVHAVDARMSFVTPRSAS